MPLEWLPIEDFSAGIYSAPGARRSGLQFIGAISPPLGSARVGNTWGCLPGPGGKGLIPGFWSPVTGDDSAFQHRFTEADLSDAKVNAPYQMSGFALQTFADGTKFPMLAVVYADDDGKMTWKLMRDTTNVASDKASNVLTKYFGTQLAFQRLWYTSPYDFPGVPVCGFGYSTPTISWTSGLGTGNGLVGWFPNPSAMGVDGTQRFGFHGFALAHQNRFAFIVNTSNAYKLGNTSTYYDAEEAIYYSEPPNANLVPFSYGNVHWPENPSGYAAWGSLNASSLLLVKRVGGAILLQGDVLYPQVTYLPGVQPTGNLMSVPCVGQLGVIYASDGAGVWAWQGGSTAVKISRQLDDQFFRYLQADVSNVFEAGTGIAIQGPSFQALQHGDYLFCTGGWILHAPTGGWWRLDQDSVLASGDTQTMWFGIDPYGELGATLWAIHPLAQLVTGTTYRAGYKYPLNKYASQWSWQSQPIQVGNPAFSTVVEEIVIWASRDDSATGTATITVQTIEDNAVVKTHGPFTVTATYGAQQFRCPTSSSSRFIEIKVTAANSNDDYPAPMLHKVDIGFRQDNIVLAS